MDEEQAREYYIKIKALREQVDKLSQQLNEIDQKTLDIREMIQAVKQASQIQEGDELLVALTNGVFIEATAKKPVKLRLNVGADTVVKKTPQETTKLLEQQQQELTNFRKQVRAQRNQAAQQAQDIEEEVTGHLQEDV